MAVGDTQRQSASIAPEAINHTLGVSNGETLLHNSRHGHWSGSTWTKQLRAHTPAPIARSSRRAAQWLKGPKPRTRYIIAPWLERWQTLPARLLARLPPWMRIAIYSTACITYIAIFATIITHAQGRSDIGGLGPPVRLSCVNTLWPSPQACRLDGRDCFPFSNASFAFDCPAGCASAQVLNPHAIGPHSVNYRSLVVGGSPASAHADAFVYRGDSFICSAAIHAGVISSTNGGCGLVSLIGQHNHFGAVRRNGIDSIAFDSHFPMSLAFDRTPAQCQDPRWTLLVLSTVFSALFGLFTTSPATFFAPVFAILFFQTAMASDPPPYSDYASLASTTLGRFLPAALAAALLYRFSVGISLRNCKAQVEKTILWVGGAWVGALGNYTFERIPIQRLTAHDIRQQPGAVTALVLIIIVLFVLVLYQAWCFRNEGRLPRFLALYLVLGIGLGILAAIPHLTLRMHHYIIALLLLPGTALQTRVSLLCQGLLVGLFVNGIARWGFDAILQTAAALRGDAQLGTAIPAIAEPVINGSTITFAWNSLLDGYQGVSVLVNDVERYRGSSGTTQGTYTWQRTQQGVNEYFRFGFVRYKLFGAISYSDFTRAGTWFANGTWSGIPFGRT
ncbi:hypothetical protein ACJQWK_09705 [Exserohilum turcicum]